MRTARRSRVVITCGLALLFVALALAGCDPGGRLAQLTPQPPAATPILLGVTTEPPPGSTPGATTAAPAPLPTATYDPARPAWTVLYYGGADNDRAAFVWDDLNEMEAAGPLDQVRLVAQVDWPEGGPAGTAETVRYLIQPDTDPTQLASQAVATPGELNYGDPATLADFLAWGMATYPANRYALVLGDFGGGWAGCCFDAGAGDHLSLADLDGALATALGQTGGARLEIIAFAAGLMGQVDVLQVIQPYAAYAVASPGLIPGSSWDFQALASQLNADPFIDGRQVAGDWVTGFTNAQRQLEGEEYMTMAAVDLSRMTQVSAAVEALAVALGGDPPLYAALAAEARRGAQTYGGAALTDAHRIAAVDLLHAAAIMNEVSLPGDAQTAAAAVVAAVSEAVIAYDHGQGIAGGRGLALYWPAVPATLDPAYAATSRLPSWAAFLQAATPPAGDTRLVLDGGPREVAGIGQPALMRAQLFARQVTEVALVADQATADGRRILRQLEIVQPTTQTLPGGTSAALWRDGWHESLIVWDASGSYLADAAGAGDYVPLRSADASPFGAQTGATGQFHRAGSDQSREATVVFAPGVAASSRLWLAVTAAGGARLVGEVRPAAGDVFQPATLLIDATGALSNVPGPSLVFDQTPALYRSARALPDGRYEVGLRAIGANGAPLTQTRPLTIDAAQGVAGFRAYVDVANAVEFLYPADWLPPATQDGITYTRNLSGTIQLQVRTYPSWAGDLATLQADVLGTFGEVSLLQQEPVTVGPAPGVAGLRVAYGYDSAESGPRSGAFLTFLNEGIGYVVDLDGPREAEAALLAVLDTVAATWQFLPPRLGFGPEPWSRMNVGDITLRYPAKFAYQEISGWHRFAADPQTFVAVRLQPAGRTPAEAMSGLLATASEGVAGFTADEPRRFFYAGHVWERNDFSYTDANGGIVQGLLLSRQDGETEIAVWAETPDGGADLFETAFLPTAASIERIAVAPSG